MVKRECMRYKIITGKGSERVVLAESEYPILISVNDVVINKAENNDAMYRVVMVAFVIEDMTTYYYCEKN